VSWTGISGQLPDVVPSNSPLRAIFAIGASTTDATALSGSLPASLFNAASLTFLDLSNNMIEGIIPPLPENIRLVNLSANGFVGMPESWPDGVEFFDVSYNQIAGTIPPISRNMVHLNLLENELEGGLPTFMPEEGARRRMARKLAWKSKIVIDAGRVGGFCLVFV